MRAISNRSQGGWDRRRAEGFLGLWSRNCTVFSFSRCSVASILLTLGLIPRIVHSLPRASQRALVTSSGAVAAVGPAMPWICLSVLPGEQLPAAALGRRVSGTWKLFSWAGVGWPGPKSVYMDSPRPCPDQCLSLAGSQPLRLSLLGCSVTVLSDCT